MSCMERRNCQCHGHAAPASQNLEEVRFLRSACSAAQMNDLKRLAKLLAKSPGSIDDDGIAGSSNFNRMCAALKGGTESVCKTATCPQSLAYGRAGCAGQSGYTPLHYAARAGHRDAVIMLLNAGTVTTLLSTLSCDPNTSAGRTWQLRKESMHAGADVNMATRAGRATPLHRAAYMGHTVVADVL